MSSMNPFFEVEKKKIQIAGGKTIPGKLAVVNTETGDCLGIVAPRYSIVKNQDVANLFDETVQNFAGQNYEIFDHLNQNASHWKRDYVIDKDEFSFEVSPGDVSRLMIRISNSYNGFSSMSCELMLFRNICSNGMIFGKKSLFLESFKHVSVEPEDLIVNIRSKMAAIRSNIDIWKQWVDEPMTMEDFVSFLEDKEYLGKRLVKLLQDIALARFVIEKIAYTKWAFFNVLTYSLSHIASSKKKQSAIFSHSHNVLQQAASDFYSI